MMQLLGAITLGLIFSLLALGVLISFRILSFRDLTVDGSITLGGAVTATLLVAVMVAGYFVLDWLYVPVVLRIFAEKPLFVIPRGQKPPGAEDIELTTPEGLKLKAARGRSRGRLPMRRRPWFQERPSTW